MTAQPALAIEAEISDLHRFFVAWFNGTCANDDDTFERGIAARLSADFIYVLPGGEVLARQHLLASLRDAYGSNPDFGIVIRNVRVRHSGDDVFAAFYEEWQRGAHNSQPAENGRLTTVLFRVHGARLEWHHVHETWMTAEAMALGSYDF